MAREEPRLIGVGSLMKLILFNGPPSSGKDVASRITQSAINHYSELDCRLHKFAAPIKRAVAAFLDLADNDKRSLMETELKDARYEWLFDKTMRELLISFSEDWVKPHLGDDAFGALAYRHILSQQNKTDVIVFSDSGFQSEFDYLYERHLASDIYVIRLYRDGCSYANDSRDYIDHRQAQHYTIINNSTLWEFEMAVYAMLQHFKLIP